MSVAQVVCLAIAVVACAWDLKTRRIPQLLTLGGALAGVVFHILNGGWDAGMASVVGWTVGIAIFFCRLRSAASEPGTSSSWAQLARGWVR